MKEIKIDTDYIKLDQFIKYTGEAGSGAEAKNMVEEGLAQVNGETENRRGRKLREDDVVAINGKEFKIVK